MDVKLIYVALTARVGSSGNVIFENVDAGKHTLTVIARDGKDRASEKGVCVLACMHASNTHILGDSQRPLHILGDSQRPI